jgi:hypothetical protein
MLGQDSITDLELDDLEIRWRLGRIEHALSLLAHYVTKDERELNELFKVISAPRNALSATTVRIL